MIDGTNENITNIQIHTNFISVIKSTVICLLLSLKLILKHTHTDTSAKTLTQTCRNNERHKISTNNVKTQLLDFSGYNEF